MGQEFLDTYFILLDLIKNIKQEQTGTREELCKTMNITKHQWDNFKKIFDDLNCPVKYRHKQKTYYFEHECKLKGFQTK